MGVYQQLIVASSFIEYIFHRSYMMGTQSLGCTQIAPCSKLQYCLSSKYQKCFKEETLENGQKIPHIIDIIVQDGRCQHFFACL